MAPIPLARHAPFLLEPKRKEHLPALCIEGVLRLNAEATKRQAELQVICKRVCAAEEVRVVLKRIPQFLHRILPSGVQLPDTHLELSRRPAPKHVAVFGIADLDRLRFNQTFEH